MTMIDRYDPESYESSSYGYMCKDPTGDYVKYEDAQARIAELEAALQAMVDHYVYLTDTGDFGYGDAEAEPQMVASRAALKG
jgi:hypothetical protein